MQTFLLRPLYGLYCVLLGRFIAACRFFIPGRFQDLQYWYYRHMGVIIEGSPRFIGLAAKFDTSGKILIADKVTLSEGVVIITHDYSVVNACEALGNKTAGWPLVGDVSIGRNTFVGLNTLILPGTQIGENVIVAAGSVVTGTIENDVIVGGVPAKVIGHTRDLAEKASAGTTGLKEIRLPSFRARFISIRSQK